MNQPIPTGPDLFGFAESAFDKAKAAGSNRGNTTYGSPEEIYQFQAASHHQGQALTAAVVMLTEVIASATGVRHNDLAAWREKIGMSWLKECVSRDERSPACAGWHTGDCPFSDPQLPEGTRVRMRKGSPGRPSGTVKRQKRIYSGKYRLNVQWDGAEKSWVDQDDVEIIRHEKLPEGTRVLVNDRMTRYEHKVELDGQPWAGKITGYARNSGCYLVAREWEAGRYSDRADHIYMDERVRVHPEGPQCPVPEEPVKREPTGPRVFVQNLRGKQGYLLDMERQADETVVAHVQWFSAGARPVWIDMSVLKIIPPGDVQRCPKGQTADECGSGENQCELCLADEDTVAEAIEGSMGV